VLLSLVAALVVSRPLRRITDGARAFAAGDFGHPIDITSADELGDAAKALGELAAQLRGRLLSSGADRAALHALLDDLPVGVVLYDPHGAPVVISARARELCDLSPHQELERARQIIELDAQAEVVRKVLANGFTVEAPLELPWRTPTPLRARWISIFAPDGDRQPALVVLEEGGREARIQKLTQALQKGAEKLRIAVRHVKNPLLAADLANAADDVEAELELSPPSPAQVEAVTLGALCETASGDVHANAESGGISIELALPATETKVVEAAGRSRRAVRGLLSQAIRQCGRGHTLTLRGELVDTGVRLSVRAPGAPANVTRVTELVQCLGGEAGSVRDGDVSESWLLLPRA
jgi:HAMP domain-containing protein